MKNFAAIISIVILLELVLILVACAPKEIEVIYENGAVVTAGKEASAASDETLPPETLPAPIIGIETREDNREPENYLAELEAEAVKFGLRLPDAWDYEAVSTPDRVGIRLYPEGRESSPVGRDYCDIGFYFFPDGFNMCGWGKETGTVLLEGYLTGDPTPEEVTVYYEDYGDSSCFWLAVHPLKTGGDFGFICEATPIELYEEHRDEFIEILRSVYFN